MRWATLAAAQSQLNKSPNAVRSLARLGCFRRRKSGQVEHFALEPEHDKQAVIDRFYAKHAPCRDRATCLKVKKVIDLLYGRPKVSPPTAFMDDAMLVMKATGMQMDNANLRALTGASVAVARRHVVVWCAANDEATSETRSHFALPPGDHEAHVMSRLPKHLREAPGTYQGPGGHSDCKPSERMFARLASIKNQTFFEAATLDILRLAATKVDAQVQDRSTRAFQRFDDRLQDSDPRDPFAIRDSLERELGPE